ncbi:MAG TPA: hypothetical protein VIO80_01440 [Candidatus Dormibacteraeota bacterium]
MTVYSTFGGSASIFRAGHESIDNSTFCLVFSLIPSGSVTESRTDATRRPSATQAKSAPTSGGLEPRTDGHQALDDLIGGASGKAGDHQLGGRRALVVATQGDRLIGYQRVAAYLDVETLAVPMLDGDPCHCECLHHPACAGEGRPDRAHWPAAAGSLGPVVWAAVLRA